VRVYRPDDAITGEAGACTVGQHPARIDGTLERHRLTCRRIVRTVLVVTHWTHRHKTDGVLDVHITQYGSSDSVYMPTIRAYSTIGSGSGFTMNPNPK